MLRKILPDGRGFFLGHSPDKALMVLPGERLLDNRHSMDFEQKAQSEQILPAPWGGGGKNEWCYSSIHFGRNKGKGDGE
jgi:hypothetical protein